MNHLTAIGFHENPEVVVYTKPGCHLCDVVKDMLETLQASHAFHLRVVNILEDSEANQKFKEEIPVVFINGKKAFKYYLDEKQFLKRLESIRGPEAAPSK
jgi:glutaredoxin